MSSFGEEEETMTTSLVDDIDPPETKLSREEELELVIRAKAGDRAATAALVEAHSGFARELAGKKDDAFQVAVLDLLEAIQKFDPAMDKCFRAYAQVRMRWAVKAWVKSARSSVVKVGKESLPSAWSKKPLPPALEVTAVGTKPPKPGRVRGRDARLDRKASPDSDDGATIASRVRVPSVSGRDAKKEAAVDEDREKFIAALARNKEAAVQGDEAACAWFNSRDKTTPDAFRWGCEKYQREDAADWRGGFRKGAGGQWQQNDVSAGEPLSAFAGLNLNPDAIVKRVAICKYLKEVLDDIALEQQLVSLDLSYDRSLQYVTDDEHDDQYQAGLACLMAKLWWTALARRQLAALGVEANRRLGAAPRGGELKTFRWKATGEVPPVDAPPVVRGVDHSVIHGALAGHRPVAVPWFVKECCEVFPELLKKEPKFWMHLAIAMHMDPPLARFGGDEEERRRNAWGKILKSAREKIAA
jgi:hypothetical protein